MIIAHDPGHGITHNGLMQTGTPARFDANADGKVDEKDTEADYVMPLTRSIADGIPWVTHVLLRDGPDGPSYTRRAAMAKERGAKLVLCHHVNASDKPEPHGLYAFYLPTDALGGEVAGVIARAAPKPVWRGAATPATRMTSAGATNILSCYAAVGVPAVLVEWGFATNEADRKFLSDLRWRPAIVACAAAGIAHAMAITHERLS